MLSCITHLRQLPAGSALPPACLALVSTRSANGYCSFALLGFGLLEDGNAARIGIEQRLTEPSILHISVWNAVERYRSSAGTRQAVRNGRLPVPEHARNDRDA